MDLINPDWWQEHLPLCTGYVDGAGPGRPPFPRTPDDTPDQIYGRFHVEEETYHQHTNTELGVLLCGYRGPLVYVHMQPYYLLPQSSVRMSVTPGGLIPPPAPGEVLGTVSEAYMDGMQGECIGNAQAWYDPEDRFIVLWECFIHRPLRHALIQHDPIMIDLWDAFETFLRQRFIEAERFVSTDRDSLTTDEDYQAFLTDRGYTRLTPWAFSKPLA